jgi:hypothetical protein
MEPRPALAQEAGDRGIGPERLDQLELAAPRPEEAHLHALGLDRLAPGTARARHGFESLKDIVDGLDGDGDMVERQALDNSI